MASRNPGSCKVALWPVILLTVLGVDHARGALLAEGVIDEAKRTADLRSCDLSIPDIKLSNNSEFRFRPGPSEMVGVLPISPSGDGVIMGVTAHYELFIDESDISAKGGCDYFTYTFYARRRDSSHLPPYLRFPMKGYPVGGINDDRLEVGFLLGGEGGKIDIPIFGCSQSLISPPTFSDPVEVKISSGLRLALNLRNPLSNVTVIIARPFQEPTSFNREYWKEIKLVASGEAAAPILIPPNGSTGNQLILDASPNSGSAFLVSLFSLNSRIADDHIAVTLVYGTKGGMKRPMSIDVPVRFVPWAPLLFVVVLIGSIVGFTIDWIARRRRGVGRIWKELLLMALIALIGEAVAMVLAAHRSEVRILGFDLDPFQLLPAFLLGSGVGVLGVSGCKALLDVFRRRAELTEVKSQ